MIRLFKSSTSVGVQLRILNSMPVSVFTAKLDQNTIATIHDPKLERQQYELNSVQGQKNLAMPLHFRGHYHWPAEPTSYQQFAQLLLATENAVYIHYQPSRESPREAIFRVTGQHFEQLAQNEQSGSQLRNFFSEKFASAYNCEDEQCQDSSSCVQQHGFLRVMPFQAGRFNSMHATVGPSNFSIGFSNHLVQHRFFSSQSDGLNVFEPKWKKRVFVVLLVFGVIILIIMEARANLVTDEEGENFGDESRRRREERRRRNQERLPHPPPPVEPEAEDEPDEIPWQARSVDDDDNGNGNNEDNPDAPDNWRNRTN
ncbi:hypothetical protein niasHT_000186 [Heterodera trifolii]|uniref:Uncharacterized protein n=1 Tax=Heterodera trifolii TaxID=157864 RepID=A0ABD2LVG4_9BILA